MNIWIALLFFASVTTFVAFMVGQYRKGRRASATEEARGDGDTAPSELDEHAEAAEVADDDVSAVEDTDAIDHSEKGTEVRPLPLPPTSAKAGQSESSAELQRLRDALAHSDSALQAAKARFAELESAAQTARDDAAKARAELETVRAELEAARRELSEARSTSAEAPSPRARRADPTAEESGASSRSIFDSPSPRGRGTGSFGDSGRSSGESGGGDIWSRSRSSSSSSSATFRRRGESVSAPRPPAAEPAAEPAPEPATSPAAAAASAVAAAAASAAAAGTPQRDSQRTVVTRRSTPADAPPAAPAATPPAPATSESVAKAREPGTNGGGEDPLKAKRISGEAADRILRALDADANLARTHREAFMAILNKFVKADANRPAVDPAPSPTPGAFLNVLQNDPALSRGQRETLLMLYTRFTKSVPRA